LEQVFGILGVCKPDGRLLATDKSGAQKSQGMKAALWQGGASGPDRHSLVPLLSELF